MVQRLIGRWYQHRLAPALWPLLPFSWLFGGLVVLRRWLYRAALLHSHRLPVPVVVVGNLTVGGSGKTPLVLWLVNRLCEQGWRPGIISRGYGGSDGQVRPVDASSPSSLVGDEPLLLARRSGVPVFVGRDRPAVGQALLAAHPECDVIVSDDGLQHYRLGRDVEIVVVDEATLGNRLRLPAGPLREGVGRIATSTLVMAHGALSAGLRGRLGRVPVFEFSLVGFGIVSAYIVYSVISILTDHTYHIMLSHREMNFDFLLRDLRQISELLN